MKKADNFDASKWLVENKITTQSRLNELLNYDKVEQLSKKAIEDYISSNNLGTISSIISLGMVRQHEPDEAISTFEIVLEPTGKTINISAQYDANYNLTDIKVNTSKPTNSDKEFIEIEYPSGDYTGDIENGKVEFLLIDDSIEDKYEEGFLAIEGDENIMNYLGKNHFFTKLYNTIGGTFSTESDAVGITVDLNDLKSKFKKYIVDIY
jgi:hypothetical protein